MQPKFSVALIARNEEKTLPRLVESLKEFQSRGGEIILLDTGSTDNTAKLAASLGCTVHEVGDKFRIKITAETADRVNAKFVVGNEAPVLKADDTMFDFSSARNHIASLAKNDFVAMPDCDEIFTKFDIDKINSAIEAGSTQLEYNFVYSHDSEGHEVIKFKHCKFYNRTKLYWKGIIHEVLAIIPGQESVPAKFLNEEVIKLEHWQNPETNRSGYLRGLAYDCYLDSMNDRNAHYFGRELLYTFRLHSAIAQLKHHVSLNAWPAERSESMLYIGDAYSRLGDDVQAFGWYVKAYETAPTRREALMRLAQYYYEKKMPDQTIAFASAALQVKRGDEFYGNYQPYYENLPHEMLYWALWIKDEPRASLDHFQVCFDLQPFNPKYLHDFRFYFKLPKISFVIPTLGREEGLKKLLESIKNLNYPQDKIETIVLEDSPRLGVPMRLKEGVSKATGDWIVFAANDLEFTPDSIMIAFKTAMDSNKYFMAFNTNSPEETKVRQCEHFMIHKKLIPRLGGEIFDTEFNHVGVDDLLWAKLSKIGQAMRCGKAIVHHNHFSRPGGKMDEVYELGWNAESLMKDRALLEKKLQELNDFKGNGDQEKFNG